MAVLSCEARAKSVLDCKTVGFSCSKVAGRLRQFFKKSFPLASHVGTQEDYDNLLIQVILMLNVNSTMATEKTSSSLNTGRLRQFSKDILLLQ